MSIRALSSSLPTPVRNIKKNISLLPTCHQLAPPIKSPTLLLLEYHLHYIRKYMPASSQILSTAAGPDHVDANVSARYEKLCSRQLGKDSMFPYTFFFGNDPAHLYLHGGEFFPLCCCFFTRATERGAEIHTEVTRWALYLRHRCANIGCACTTQQKTSVEGTISSNCKNDQYRQDVAWGFS